MKTIITRLMIPVLMLIATVSPVVLSATPAAAINLFPTCTDANKDTAVCKSTDDEAGSLIRTVINILLFVLGAIAVIMIVIGGIRYTTSNGDASGIKGAKDTILYSVIGLVVALLAYAIVNFVLGRF